MRRGQRPFAAPRFFSFNRPEFSGRFTRFRVYYQAVFSYLSRGAYADGGSRCVDCRVAAVRGRFALGGRRAAPCSRAARADSRPAFSACVATRQGQSKRRHQRADELRRGGSRPHRTIARPRRARQKSARSHPHAQEAGGHREGRAQRERALCGECAGRRAQTGVAGQAGGAGFVTGVHGQLQKIAQSAGRGKSRAGDVLCRLGAVAHPHGGGGARALAADARRNFARGSAPDRGGRGRLGKERIRSDGDSKSRGERSRHRDAQARLWTARADARVLAEERVVFSPRAQRFQ